MKQLTVFCYQDTENSVNRSSTTNTMLIFHFWPIICLCMGWCRLKVRGLSIQH